MITCTLQLVHHTNPDPTQQAPDIVLEDLSGDEANFWLRGTIDHPDYAGSILTVHDEHVNHVSTFTKMPDGQIIRTVTEEPHVRSN